MDVNVDVIVDVVVGCWPYACSREAGRLPLWIEFLALSARIGGAVPRGNSILQDVQMSRCENSLTSTSTSTSTSTACVGHPSVIYMHPSVPKMFNLFPDTS